MPRINSIEIIVSWHTPCQYSLLQGHDRHCGNLERKSGCVWHTLKQSSGLATWLAISCWRFSGTGNKSKSTLDWWPWPSGVKRKLNIIMSYLRQKLAINYNLSSTQLSFRSDKFNPVFLLPENFRAECQRKGDTGPNLLMQLSSKGKQVKGHDVRFIFGSWAFNCCGYGSNLIRGWRK